MTAPVPVRCARCGDDDGPFAVYTVAGMTAYLCERCNGDAE